MNVIRGARKKERLVKVKIPQSLVLGNHGFAFVYYCCKVIKPFAIQYVLKGYVDFSPRIPGLQEQNPWKNSQLLCLL